MPAPSLYDCAWNTLARRIHLLYNVGNIPWQTIGPLVCKVDNPSQLEELEAHSEWLKKYTGEVWLGLIKRDAPPGTDLSKFDTNTERDWPQLYRKLKQQRDKRVNQSTRILAARLKAGEDEKKSNEVLTTTKRIKTSNKQWTRNTNLPAHRIEPLKKAPPGAKLISKAVKESNAALAARKKSLKPVVASNGKDLNAKVGGEGKPTVGRGHAPAPLSADSAAMLRAKQRREAGLPPEPKPERVPLPKWKSTPLPNKVGRSPLEGPGASHLSEASAEAWRRKKEREASLRRQQYAPARKPNTLTGRSGSKASNQPTSTTMQRPAQAAARSAAPPLPRTPLSAGYKGTMKRSRTEDEQGPAVKRQRVV